MLGRSNAKAWVSFTSLLPSPLSPKSPGSAALTRGPHQRALWEDYLSLPQACQPQAMGWSGCGPGLPMGSTEG